MNIKAVIPILGFEQTLHFKLEPIDEIFYQLTNKEAETPSFTLIQPAALRDDYIFDLPKGIAEKLELTTIEDAMVLNIMILQTPIENSHINFMAPLIFNMEKGVMAQVVLDSVKYPTFGLADPLSKFINLEENVS